MRRLGMQWVIAGCALVLLGTSGCGDNGGGGGDDVVADAVDGTGEIGPGACNSAAECDDSDPCTVDSCVESQCINEARACDDGLFCNGEESCDPVSGECLEGTPPTLDDGVMCTQDTCDEDADEVTHVPDDAGCDDGDPCTDDLCDPDSGCQNPPNTAGCDDEDPCTEDDVCLDGACAGTPKACDDGLFCNGEESCDADTGECLDGTAPVVDDEIDCTLDSCDEDAGEVTHTPDAAACDDDNPCTDDVCDPEEGCVHTNNSKPCDDGLACTEDDTCTDGACVGFSMECDDGLFCNGAETCDDETGECLPGIAPTVDDAIACTMDTCDEDSDEVVHLPDHAVCADEDVCTDDVCDLELGCQNPFNTAPCDDADPCTVDDVCAEGLCAGAPKDCSDGLFCNGSETCEAGTGACLPGTPPTLDDAIACTADACDEDADEVTHTPDDAACDDSNPCTDDSCDPVLGCQHVDNTAACDDGDLCTTEDVCGDGVCAGAPVDCSDGAFCNGAETCDGATGECVPGTPPVVDDEIECTVDACDEEADEVTHTADDAVCDDGNVCTDDLCAVGAGCEYSDNTDPCDDLDPCTVDDVCGGGVCAGAAVDCSDGAFCNGEEVCDGSTGECVAGTPPALDDGVACTTDECDEEGDVVLHTPDNGACDDGNVCTDDVCDAADDCTYTDNTDPCDDGEACTDGDVCADGSCTPGGWTCEDCTNGQDDNGDELTDCCDPLCTEDAACLAESVCDDAFDDDCDGLTDCADDDCVGDEACGPYPLPGELVITEILQNPTAVDDTVGEWFEIYNNSEGLTFDLRYMEVTDAGQDSFVVATSLPIAPGQFLVLGRNADIEVNGGVIVDYEYTGFSMSNADDEIMLTLNDVVIDAVAWDGGPDFPDPDGASMELEVTLTDADLNDAGSAWCEARTPFGTGEPPDLGTPGMMNVPCFETLCQDGLDGDLDALVDCDDPDCDADPTCVDSDGDGVPDIFDVCPGAPDDVDGNGNGVPDGCEIGWAGEAWPNSGTSLNAFLPASFYLQVYMADVTPGPGAGEGVRAWLRYRLESDLEFTEVPMVFNQDVGNNDEFSYTVPVDELAPEATLIVEYRVAFETSNSVVHDYPGGPIQDQAANEVPFTYDLVVVPQMPLPGDLLITEILQNPAGVSDGVGEWFEVYNLAAYAIDVAGLVVSDAGADSFTVGESLVVYPGAYLVFGNNADAGVNGGVAVDFEYGTDMALANGDDEVILTYGGELIDQVYYDGGPAFPDPSGASMTLSPAAYATDLNDDGGNWCEATSAFGAGDLGTPGADNDACAP